MRSGGSDALETLTLQTERGAYARPSMDVTGGGRATSLASRHWGREGAIGPAKPQNALEVREQHLDLLAIAARLRERLRFGEGTSDIACGLVHIADDPSRWHVRAAKSITTGRAILSPTRSFLTGKRHGSVP